jgi:hypothetical protein
MKRLFTLSVALLIALSVFTQAPQKMSYQCVVRNSNGVLMTNQSVGIKISILQGTPLGTVVFQETYSPNPQTNSNGLLTVEIGSGYAVIGTFSAINWAAGPYFLKTEADPTGGTSYTITGTSQLLSVPYALYARTASTANYNDLSNLPSLNISNWNTAYGWGNHSGLYRPIGWVPAWGDVTGKPAFATVATSGSYNDLSNRPTILNSQWTTSGSNIYFNSGNVGIGILTPSEKIDVIGNIEVSGDYKYSNSKTEYYHVGCSEFAPRNGDIGTWALHGDQEYGCFAGITGTWRSYATLHLPDGAIVDEVRIYYVDCSSNNMTIYFRRTSSDGITRVNMGSATSTETDSPSSPVARQISFNPNATIDNLNNRYTIIFESAQNDNNHRLYNVRVRYTINKL